MSSCLLSPDLSPVGRVNTALTSFKQVDAAAVICQHNVVLSFIFVLCRKKIEINVFAPMHQLTPDRQMASQIYLDKIGESKHVN